MNSMEFSGKTIDEAIFTGLKEMGLSIDEVEIETVQLESKGVFGIGSKKAVVRLTQRDPIPFDPEPLLERPAQDRAPRREERRDRGERPERRERNDRGPRQGRDNRRQGRSNQERAPREANPPMPQYDYSQEAAQDLPAAQFLQGLLPYLGVKGTISAAQLEEGYRLRIDGSNLGVLIGRRGQTLDALQYLTSLVVNKNRKQDGYSRITLDVEDYRAKREQTLIRLARREAGRVRSTGTPIAMEPMSPYERRILHSTLQEIPYVTTHSEGEEPNRYVIISPAQEQE